MAEETDRVYHGLAPAARVAIHDGAARTVAVVNDGFTDAGAGPKRPSVRLPAWHVVWR